MAAVTVERKMDGFPLYDDATGTLDFGTPPVDRAAISLDDFAGNREKVIVLIRTLADELDGMKRNCDVSYIAGSSVGIVGGTAMIAGLIVMPPLAIGGAIIGGVGAATNVVTGIVKVVKIKNSARVVIEWLEQDKKLYETYRSDLAEAMSFDGKGYNQSPPSSAGLSPSAAPSLAVPIASATASSVCVASSRAVVAASGRLAPAVMMSVAHGAAGVGILLDLISLVSSSKNIATGARLTYAMKLREVADDLEAQLVEERACFTQLVLPL